MNKDEILDALEDSREAFLDLLDQVPDELWEQPGVSGEWSIKDILYILTMREAELVKMLWQIDQGISPGAIMQEGEAADIRAAQWKIQGQTRSLDQVVNDFRGVRKQTYRRLLPIHEKAFEDTSYYPWLNNQPLWQWVAAASFEYETKQGQIIKKWLEGYKQD